MSTLYATLPPARRAAADRLARKLAREALSLPELIVRVSELVSDFHDHELRRGKDTIATINARRRERAETATAALERTAAILVEEAQHAAR